MTPHEIELHAKICRYLDDGHQTKADVGEIEWLAIDHFQNEPWFDEISYDLAMFNPGGETYYLDEKDLSITLTRLRHWLKAERPVKGAHDAGNWVYLAMCDAWCNGGRGAVRPLLVDGSSVVLLCDECSAVWLHPDDVNVVAPVSASASNWDLGPGLSTTPWKVRWASLEEADEAGWGVRWRTIAP